MNTILCRVGGRKEIFMVLFYIGSSNEPKFLGYMFERNLNWHKTLPDDGRFWVVPTDFLHLVGLLAISWSPLCETIAVRHTVPLRCQARIRKSGDFPTSWTIVKRYPLGKVLEKFVKFSVVAKVVPLAPKTRAQPRPKPQPNQSQNHSSSEANRHNPSDTRIVLPVFFLNSDPSSTRFLRC